MSEDGTIKQKEQLITWCSLSDDGFVGLISDEMELYPFEDCRKILFTHPLEER
jgi:hypothetical protein